MNALLWLKGGLNAGTLITIITVSSGLIAAHGRDRERMDELERRITVYEQRGVKRTDLDTRDKSMTTILQSIDARLSTIERVLMERGK